MRSSSWLTGLHHLCRSMCFPPVTRRNAFPAPECASKRIWIFEAQEIGCLVQLQSGVAEVVSSHLVTRLIENALEARARVLQTTLQGPRTHVKRPRYCIDGRAMTSKPVLYGAAHQVYEAILLFV